MYWISIGFPEGIIWVCSGADLPSSCIRYPVCNSNQPDRSRSYQRAPKTNQNDANSLQTSPDRCFFGPECAVRINLALGISLMFLAWKSQDQFWDLQILKGILKESVDLWKSMEIHGSEPARITIQPWDNWICCPLLIHASLISTYLSGRPDR